MSNTFGARTIEEKIDPLAQASADLRTSRTSVYGFQEERGIARE